LSEKAFIFDIKRDCSEDGPGIRTTVFFKGCPLSCNWCQNPEGKTHDVNLSFIPNLCKPQDCNVACVPVCEAHCLRFVDKLQVDFSACTRCNNCFTACPTKALKPVGYWISLDELMYQVCIDKPIFSASGGGVTLSGGEATQQMDFCSVFLQALKKHNIHTALETSGFFNYRRFQNLILPYLDIIYFDLKLINEEKAKQNTGQSNKLIIDNFIKLIQEQNVKVIPRIPLIPGVTDTEENLVGWASFLKQHNSYDAVLLPYNPLWIDKMAQFGLTPMYQHKKHMSQQDVEKCIYNFQSGM